MNSGCAYRGRVAHHLSAVVNAVGNTSGAAQGTQILYSAIAVEKGRELTSVSEVPTTCPLLLIALA